MAKTMTGVVSSDKGDKTIVVTVATRKTHPLYKKQYTVSKKFMAHDEKNEAKPGDRVTIAETKPLSARKRFTLVKVVERATIRHEEPVVTEKPKDSKKKIDATEVVTAKEEA
jgi:small subunit ribosomal protein S17